MSESGSDTQKQIADHLVQRTMETWGAKKEPYLLSHVSTELKPQGIDYKSVIGPGTTLKQFASTLSGLRLVVHPIQKAKVGLVPADSGFSYEVAPSLPSTNERPRKPRMASRKYAVLQFLEAIAKLPDEDARSVIIPVHILAKLVED